MHILLIIIVVGAFCMVFGIRNMAKAVVGLSFAAVLAFFAAGVYIEMQPKPEAPTAQVEEFNWDEFEIEQ